MAYIIIKFLSGIAFIASIAWCIAFPGYEPLIAIFTALIAFVGAWVGEGKSKQQAAQNQSVSEKSIGIQSGGNVSINISNSSDKE